MRITGTKVGIPYEAFPTTMSKEQLEAHLEILREVDSHTASAWPWPIEQEILDCEKEIAIRDICNA